MFTMGPDGPEPSWRPPPPQEVATARRRPPNGAILRQNLSRGKITSYQKLRWRLGHIVVYLWSGFRLCIFFHYVAILFDGIQLCSNSSRRASWSHVGVILVLYWTILESSWSLLGVILDHFGVSLEPARSH